MQFERKGGKAIYISKRSKGEESNEPDDEQVGLNRNIDAFLQDKSDNEVDEEGNRLTR